MEWRNNESVPVDHLSVNSVFIKVIDHQFKNSEDTVMSAQQLVVERISSLINFNETNYLIWFMTLFCASIIGLTGVFPLIILPSAFQKDVEPQKKQETNKTLKLMLSFSVGGLLGDVFLHLLPESWSYIDKSIGVSNQESFIFLGFWVVLGIFSFITIERLAVLALQPSNVNEKNFNELNYSSRELNEKNKFKSTSIITGYLNLFANSVDNFTHGLAVGASFLVGAKVGLSTTLAIIVHEVPHELGDFAILIKSGFSKWEAVKAQLSTASVGLLGAIVALSADSADSIGQKTFWILPFTAGGFLHIAMVSILPELLKEDNPWESTKQIICIISGIAVMAMFNLSI